MVVLPKDKKIILFDGVCNLCNTAVEFVINRDGKDVFRFLSLQSESGQQILKQIGIANKSLDSIILYQPGIAYYIKSEAAFEIAREVGGLWYLLLFFKILPVHLTDALYDYVAANRYKWFGKKDSCMLPTETNKAKFLQ